MMAFVLGVDTYITVEESTALASELYLSTDALYLKWQNLSISDKRVYLRRATKLLDAKLYRGRGAINGQPLQFPRYIDGVYIEIGHNIKASAFLLAIKLLNKDTSPRLKVIEDGVTTLRLSDGTSESYTAPVAVEDSPDILAYIKNFLI